MEDTQKLERTQKIMTRWMRGVTLRDKKSNEELSKSLGWNMIVSDVVRHGMLGWFRQPDRKKRY